VQNVILIVKSIFKEIVITVTDEFSHCRTISAIKPTPHTARGVVGNIFLGIPWLIDNGYTSTTIMECKRAILYHLKIMIGVFLHNRYVLNSQCSTLM